MHLAVNTLFFLPGEVGGTETYLLETFAALAALPDAPERITLFANEENDGVLRARFEGLPGLEVEPLGVRARNRPARILAEQTLLRGAVRRAGATVLWSPGYTPLLFPPCPQVTTLHDVQYRTHPEDLSRSYRLATDFFCRAALRHSRRVLTISRFAQDEIRRHFGANPDRVASVPLAADEAFARPASADELRAARDNLAGGRPYLLCTAFSHPHKNLHTLALAYARVQPDIPHALVIVGKPRRGEDRLREALRAVPDPSRVHRVDRLPQEGLVLAVQAADVFVFPSVYEGFGLPALEAQMAGVPLITTACASLPEVTGGHALIFEPDQPEHLAQKIREVLAWSLDRRLETVAKAREHARGFTWLNTAAATLRVLREAEGEGRT